jgi:phosphomannomutase
VLGVPEDCTDGWRWSRPDGFVHIRPSGTEPIVRVIVETASGEAATELLERLRATLRGV